MPEDTPADKAVAIGMSLTANIDPGRQIVFQTFVALDATDDEKRRVTDAVLDLADHAEKRYTVKGLKIALASHEESLRKTNEAAAEQAGKIETLLAAYEREWDAGGKRGEFKLMGVQKTNVDNQRLTLDNQKQTIVNLTDQIARTKEKIAELERAA